MVVDSSALFAIEFLEDEAVRFDRLLRSGGRPLMSAATAVELMIALTRRRHEDQQRAVEDLIATYAIEIVALDENHMRQAWSGFARFGKGGGHPAQLNFGDCFAYALAKSTDLPLLFKGDDFSATDIAIVL